MANLQHSPSPWKLTVAGNTWGLAHKGANPRESADLANGSTLSDRWEYDAALMQASPALLSALQRLVEAPTDPDAVKAAKAAIRKATKPVS